MLEDVPGVDDGDDGVELELRFHFLVGEESLRDGAWIGQAGGFDENEIELVLAFEQFAEDADEIAANGAADAAVVHFEDFFLGLDHQILIDADLAEFIFDDGNAFAVLSGEDMVEQGGLAGAEEAGENGDGDALVGGHVRGTSGLRRARLILWAACGPGLGAENSGSSRRPMARISTMSIMTPLLKKPAVVYPESDGLPLADNTKQFRWIMTIQGGLDAQYLDDPDVFVAGNLLWYPVEGDNKTRSAPDAFVAFGRPKGDRGSYRQWVEGNVPPQVVFEIVSPGNSQGVLTEKFNFFDRHGVEEYYLYDPDENALDGWLRKGGRLKKIPAWMAG